MEYNCEFCKSLFKTKYGLDNHKKTAKYCLQLRGNNNTSYCCTYCTKVYTQKKSLLNHESICPNKLGINNKKDLIIRIEYLEKSLKEKEKYILEKDKIILRKNKNLKEKEKSLEEKEKIILEKNKLLEENKIYIKELELRIYEDLQKRNQELEDKYERVTIEAIKRPTTINYIEKLEITSDEHLSNQSKFLTLDHIKKEEDGYAEFAVECAFDNRIACVDFARKKILYKNEKGDMIVDMEMSDLYQRMCQSIQDRNNELIEQYKIEAEKKYGIDAMSVLIKMTDNQVAIKYGAMGVENKMGKKIIKKICQKALAK